MAYTGDLRIQGLHVANVLNVSKALVAKLSTFQIPPSLRAELTDLEDAVNRLVQFEREAITRGTLKHGTDAGDLVAALDAARGLLNATPSQREALHMSTQDAAEEFSVDGLMTDMFGPEPPKVAEAQPVAGDAKTEPAPAPRDDPWEVP